MVDFHVSSTSMSTFSLGYPLVSDMVMQHHGTKWGMFQVWATLDCVWFMDPLLKCVMIIVLIIILIDLIVIWCNLNDIPVLSTLDYSPRYTATPGYRLTEPVRIQPAPPYPKISCLGLEGTRVEAEKHNKVHLKKTGKRHGLDIERSDIHRFWNAPLTRIQPEPWPFATQDLQRAEDDLATTGRPTKFMATPQGLCGGCAKHMGVCQICSTPDLWQFIISVGRSAGKQTWMSTWVNPGCRTRKGPMNFAGDDFFHRRLSFGVTVW
jgi:hypothetical protein